MIAAQQTHKPEVDSLGQSLPLLLVSACRVLCSRTGARLRSISVCDRALDGVTDVDALRELSEEIASDYGLAADVDVRRRGITVVVRR